MNTCEYCIFFKHLLNNSTGALVFPSFPEDYLIAKLENPLKVSTSLRRVNWAPLSGQHCSV